MREIVLINIIGSDRPGLLAAITGALAEDGVRILDIAQSLLHGAQSLAVVASADDSARLAVLRERIQAVAGPQARFTALSEKDYLAWAQGGIDDRYVLTLMSREITAAQVQSVTEIAARHGLAIEAMDRLSGRPRLHAAAAQAKACVEFTASGVPADIAALRRDFLAAAMLLDADIAIQHDDLYRRNRRLAVFDMDSTLIQAEVIDELAKAHGVGHLVSEITERAMRGELDFRASFKERMALLQGLDVSVLDAIGASLRLTEGAEVLFAELKRLGYKTAILSGGFTYFAKQVQAKLGIDYVFANELQVVDGKCTGVAVEPIVDAQRKADLLVELAEKEGLTLEQTIAVGDGANDLPMLAKAGLGVAFRAKPLVKQSARHNITTLGLDGVLYLLGVRDGQA
ncbi:phosphoserine phosphatase SerB [Pseudomonas sp.]|uniref:phosphoserine phosphatase SerB n=1 Tax=Pseudomonas sp. TaxID=306 RepID=UPI003CC5E000